MRFNKLCIDQTILNLHTYIGIIIINAILSILVCCFVLLMDVSWLVFTFRASLRNKMYVLAVKA